METPLLRYYSYNLLLIIQALHLVHHRFAKRHISYVEGAAGIAIFSTHFIPSDLIAVFIHLIFCVVQIAGSLFIKKLSPEYRT